jgi:DNA topoisomerase-1
VPFEWPSKVRFIHPSERGFERRRHGRGFVYVRPDGRRVQDRGTMLRIAAIAIPPAWSSVWIAPTAHAHLQATGRDARERKQYRYHPAWSLARREANYARMVDFARALPQIRAYVDAGLRRPCLDRDRVLALALRLLDTGMIRVGNEEYARSNGSRGLTTLRKRNVDVDGDDIELHFTGKGGVEYSLAVHDPRAARALRRCHELPGQRLFRYPDAMGELHGVTSSDINALLEELTGRHFTAKDFRTWAGTVTTYEQLAACEPGTSDAETARIVNEAVRRTASVLGNTLAVCKRYYVHPRVVAAFSAGEIKRPKRPQNGAGAGGERARESTKLTGTEAALARLLATQR